jgi:hypothetical protein
VAAASPAPDAVLEKAAEGEAKGGTRDWLIGRRDVGDRVPVRVWAPPARGTEAVLVVHPGGIAGVSARMASLIDPLLRQRRIVASLDVFNTGGAPAARDASDPFFTTTTARTTPTASRMSSPPSPG